MVTLLHSRNASAFLSKTPGYWHRHSSSMSTKHFKPKPVERIEVESLSSERFLSDCLLRSPARPLHLVQKTPITEREDIIETMLKDPASEQCMVELEIGRYDKEFEKVQLPLAYYLRWLKDGTEGGQMQGKQVYLAQWRGLEDIPSLKRALKPPPFLQGLLDSNRADMYQESFFVGAVGATTPLHFDPYINLFSLAGSSDASAAKHFLILPPSPSVTALVKPGEGSFLRNTSPVDFFLQGNLAEGGVDSVGLAADSPSQGHVEELGREAFGVTLRAGEMLLLPQRWWHRVQNIGRSDSWTAGLGYWFRLR